VASGPGDVHQPVGDPAQQRVAERMAEEVVDVLEVLEAHEQQGAGRGRAVGQRLLEHLQELIPVRQAGDVVALGRALGRSAVLLARRLGLAAQLEERAVGQEQALDFDLATRGVLEVEAPAAALADLRELRLHVILDRVGKNRRGAVLEDVGIPRLRPAQPVRQTQQVFVAAVPQPQRQVRPHHRQALADLLQPLLKRCGIDYRYDRHGFAKRPSRALNP